MLKKYFFTLLFLFHGGIQTYQDLCVKDYSGRTVLCTISIEPHMNFLDIKKEIQKGSGIPVEQQELYVAGHRIQVKDNESINFDKHLQHIKVRRVDVVKAPVVKAAVEKSPGLALPPPAYQDPKSIKESKELINIGKALKVEANEEAILNAIRELQERIASFLPPS